MPVPLIFWMHNYNSTCAYQLGSGSGDYHLFTILCLPNDINQSSHTIQSFDLSVSNGGFFNWIVDIRPQIFNDFSTLKQVDKDRLSNGSVIICVRKILFGKITRQSYSSCSIAHGLSKIFDSFSAQFYEIPTLPSAHFPTMLLLDSEFNVDSIAVHSPWEIDFLAK